MVCIEPITFYPYAVEQRNLNDGFQYLEDGAKTFKVWIFTLRNGFLIPPKICTESELYVYLIIKYHVYEFPS